MINLQTAPAIEATLPDWPEKSFLWNAEKGQSTVDPLPGDDAPFSADLPIRLFPTQKRAKASHPEFTMEESLGKAGKPNRDPGVFQPRVDDTSWKALVAQRQSLVKKKFGPGLTPQEARRLCLLEWQLNRMDMASYRATLTRLEEMVARQEAVAQNLNMEVRRLQKR